MITSGYLLCTYGVYFADGTVDRTSVCLSPEWLGADRRAWSCKSEGCIYSSVYRMASSGKMYKEQMSPKSKEMWLMHIQTDTGYEQRNLYRLPRIFSKSAEKHSVGLRMRLEMENKKLGRWGGGHKSFKKSSSHLKILGARTVPWQAAYGWPKNIERHQQKFSRPGDLSFGNYSSLN